MADHENKEHGSGESGHSKGGGHGSHGNHGGGGHEEHEGAPEWLISFADNVALMMGFFVILLAMNMNKPSAGGIGGQDKNPSNEMTDFVLAMRAAFNNPVSIDSTNPNDQELVRRLRQLQQEGETKDPGPPGDKRNLQSIRPSDYAVPCAVVPFEEDASDLSTSARNTIAETARRLAGHRFVIDVRGNVSAAEAFRTDDRGMMLSYRRAFAVAKALEANGLSPRQLRVIADGDTHRITPRASSASGHRSNQRTELYQTVDIMPDDPYARDESSASADGPGH
ncbi:MAG: OmpA family protein [Phycisphaeraceae bacterium]|nr:OmpA family protein [Phycisphaeraceae bacterium]